MTKDERNALIEMANSVTVEFSEAMNINDMKYFVKGYELAHLNICDAIDNIYRSMKTD